MRIVCQQTILMKYHALFVIFEKSSKICNCRLLQIIGGPLRVKATKVHIKQIREHTAIFIIGENIFNHGQIQRRGQGIRTSPEKSQKYSFLAILVRIP